MPLDSTRCRVSERICVWLSEYPIFFLYHEWENSSVFCCRYLRYTYELVCDCVPSYVIRRSFAFVVFKRTMTFDMLRGEVGKIYVHRHPKCLKNRAPSDVISMIAYFRIQHQPLVVKMTYCKPISAWSSCICLVETLFLPWKRWIVESTAVFFPTSFKNCVYKLCCRRLAFCSSDTYDVDVCDGWR